ncbi:MAG: 3-hydroxyacyl-(acyl-carrier-protein) dehydratase FabZ [Firmicutes bacterium ADurb.Bin356]|nr:MAG: 3-hydroxyacyl-(acyl-carrier-protein) dehydratase FabZ [Firmicutes bacterium ADurb.Bin356]
MLSLEEIKEILPHREPFLLIDRVDAYEPGAYAEGVKAVCGNEWYFRGHFAKEKVMPGVLIVEAMAQMGAVALLTLEQMKGRLAFLAKIRNARFYKKVVPGDLLMLKTHIELNRENMGIGKGTAFVNGERVACCELVFALN